MDEKIEEQIQKTELERMQKKNILLDLEIELQKISVERERAVLDHRLQE